MHKKIFFFGFILLSVFVLLGLKVAKLAPLAFQLLFTHNVVLNKSDEHVNLLLLGIAGGDHDGPNLTDTILFASLDPQRNKITLVSIPRDLWISELNAKVNTAYAIGESKRKDGGLILANKVASTILNKPINYVLRIDFSGFLKAIDILGGIDVNLQKEFDDHEYPIDGKEKDNCGYLDEEINARAATSSSALDIFPCRYVSIHFDQGLQHLSGVQALEVVRSRHAEGDEGTDFARSKRQEAVMQGIKNKAFSLGTLLNPGRVVDLYDLLKESIHADIKDEEVDDFIRLFQKMKSADIQSAVLDYGDEKQNRPGLLVNPPLSAQYDNEWVLIPRVGAKNFSEIRAYVECEIKAGNCSITKNPL